MNEKILNHYREFSAYTNPGCYLDYLKNDLPDDIKEMGLLVQASIIHPLVLKNGNTGSNEDMRYGDMTKVPWYRQKEDDIFPSASAMLAELFRLDHAGLVLDRKSQDRIILSCRFVAVLTASILKSKGIPARVRSGFASYFIAEGLPANKSDDHWINQYWNKDELRWVTLDVDGMLEDYAKLDFCDLPDGKFDFSADAWLKVRRGEIDGEYFWYAGGYGGLRAILKELFSDFHCLMNNEIIYEHSPRMTELDEFKNLTENQLKEIDQLAELMQNPDDNFEELKNIWEIKKEYRLLSGGLL